MLHIIKKLSPDQRRYVLLASVVAIVLGALLLLNDTETGLAKKAEISTSEKTQTIEEKAKLYPRAREIVNPSGFLNTGGKEITIEEYIGDKVLLVDFWTYSCINCQRTQPYLNSWYEKYKDDGLLIVGIHTPEFEFEKVTENVAAAAEKYGVKYPIVQDNDYGTWAAYQNRYWPRKYIIDIDGFIVYDHIGEGGYEETELVIQKLLSERAERLGEVFSETETVNPKMAESVSVGFQRTPEIYFGSQRNGEYLGNGTPSKLGTQEFVPPDTLQKNKVYLDGSWSISGEYAQNTEKGARIVIPYTAQKVFFVASSKEGAQVTILIDGKKEKTVSIEEEDLYRLIESQLSESHTLEIVVEEGIIEAFTFTFG